MHKFKNKGLWIGIATDCIPIILSALAQNNLTNSTLRDITYFCYSIRFELVCILIILVSALLFMPILKRIWHMDTYKINFSIFITLVIIALSYSFINIKRIAVDRRNYFREDMYLAQTQIIPFREANKSYDNGDFEKARDLYEKVIKHQPNGYFSEPSTHRISQIDDLLVFRNSLFDVFDSNNQPIIRLTNYRGHEFLKGIFPGYFDFTFDTEKSRIEQAILKYESLYEAVANNDFTTTQALIKEYGWCWFEQTIWDKFSSGSQQYLMTIISEYLSAETLSSVQNRLYQKWNITYDYE